jgi:hypothetical protein
MPSQGATPDLLLKIGELIRSGSVKTLSIKPRVKGKNKGQLFVDYTVQPPVEAEHTYMQYYRQNVANVIAGAAKSLLENEDFRLRVSKQSDFDRERYDYIFEVNGERSSSEH